MQSRLINFKCHLNGFHCLSTSLSSSISTNTHTQSLKGGLAGLRFPLIHLCCAAVISCYSHSHIWSAQGFFFQLFIVQRMPLLHRYTACEQPLTCVLHSPMKNVSGALSSLSRDTVSGSKRSHSPTARTKDPINCSTERRTLINICYMWETFSLSMKNGHISR